MTDGRPPLPDHAAVWAEANAALLDLLRRADPAHTLRRLARAAVHLTGARHAHIDALSASLPVPGGRFSARHPLAGPTPGDPARDEPTCCLPLLHLGDAVGAWQLHLPPGASPPQTAERLQPLLEVTAEALAHWLAQGGRAPRDSLSMVRAAMHEGGTFVWEWDLATDSLGDIDEGARMLGYASEAIGHTQADWDRLIHPEDAPAVEAAYQAHARGQAEGYHALYRARAADGSWRWIEERGRVVERDATGRPTRMFGTQTDATVQHQLSQARQQQAAAEAASAAKTRFLSRVSHELRTPLNAVLGFAQLLDSDPADPPSPGQRRRIALIRQAGDYLLAMIGDLLDLSLVEAARLPLQPVAVPVGPLLQDCLDLLRGQAATAGVVLVHAPVPSRWAVQADPMRLKQVLINLLTNAIKYNRPGGSVQLEVRLDGQAAPPRCVIDIRDTGIGLPPERLDQLFQPFQRLGREGGPVPGSGIGLALSRALAEAMGGELGAMPWQGPEGSGTVFRLAMPLAAA
ncbi:ATP-binding protein [Ideonella sp.]|uniref:sensor histidine kinase n=1 Tax=Ideonella sp. TaxID=1929293 RepID=UPI0035B18E08